MKKSYDYPILFITILLVCIGIVMVFSASFYSAQIQFHDSYYFLKKQIMGAAAGLIGMIFFMNFSYWKLEKITKLLLIFSFILLVIVLIPGIGKNVNGASRWLNVAGVSIQPSEIAKFSIILYMASSMSRKKERMKYFLKGMFPHLLVMGIFFFLIVIQPNFSVAGSIVILVIVMLFVGEARLLHLGYLLIAGSGLTYVLIKFEAYRLKRFLIFLNPWSDPRKNGYQLIQSLYSLGAGGLFGMGLGNSRQKFLYLPYGESDFIFSIIAEELGYIGAIVLIIIFLVLIWRGIRVAITATDLFGSYLAAGITTIIAIQVIINIAVVTGSMPPTGLPLPFISAGGSAVTVFMCSIGVLLNISKNSQSG